MSRENASIGGEHRNPTVEPNLFLALGNETDTLIKIIN
jgi:hypothetical protein